jgi:hypothetical protein
MKRFLEWLEDCYGYLRFRTNWHTFPPLSRLMCWLGRHDYEFNGLVGTMTAELECFYCLHKKHSHIISRDYFDD